MDNSNIGREVIIIQHRWMGQITKEIGEPKTDIITKETKTMVTTANNGRFMKSTELKRGDSMSNPIFTTIRFTT